MEKFSPDPSSHHASTSPPRHLYWTTGTTTYASTSRGRPTNSATCPTPATPTPAWNSGAWTNSPHGKYLPTVTSHLTTLSLLTFVHTTFRAHFHAHVTPLRVRQHKLPQYAITPTVLILSELKHPLIIISSPLRPPQSLLAQRYTHHLLLHHSVNLGLSAITSAPPHALQDITTRNRTLEHSRHPLQAQLGHRRRTCARRLNHANGPPNPGPPHQLFFN